MTAFLFSIMRHLCVFMFDFRSCLMCLVYSNYITCKVAQLWIYWIYSSRQFLLQILKPELFRPFFWGGFPYSTTTMEGWPFTPPLSLWRRKRLASGSIGFAHVFRALFHFERLALLSGPGSTVPRHVCRMQQGVPPTAKITKKSGKNHQIPTRNHEKRHCDSIFSQSCGIQALHLGCVFGLVFWSVAEIAGKCQCPKSLQTPQAFICERLDNFGFYPGK